MLKKSIFIIFALAILGGFYLLSISHYLIFHSFAEVFRIVVAYGIFVIGWNCRQNLDNDYLLLLGISYIFVGSLDLVHMLAYKGMTVFSFQGSNPPTQLWIGARYIESISLCIAPIFLKRKLSTSYSFAIYGIAVSILLTSIFYWNIFPDCYVEGVGLTPFKKVSEIVISCVYIGAVFLLLRLRRFFNRRVLRFLVASIVISIGSEVAFIFYQDVYGISNFLGHILKVSSVYLIYKALISTGLVRPLDLLYRELKQSEINLKEMNITKDKFFSIIAHDLRSPLVSIITIVRYIMGENKSVVTEKDLSLIQELDVITNRTIALLDNLLVWAKCQTGDLKFDPVRNRSLDIVSESIAPLEGSARNKKITFDIDNDADLEIYADKNMLTTVVRNLVSNSIKFSHPDSVVQIIVKRDSHYARFKSNDSGIGIEKEDIKKLFEIDEANIRLGTEQEKGSGLGLILCKNFIEMNGGSIWIESELNKGTTVYFTVPLP
jgi:signal transduction histidine kinase